MRGKLVVANWKMHKSQAEAAMCAEQIGRGVRDNANVDVAICPPFLALQAVRHAMPNNLVRLGAQDVFWADEGAFTGRVSARMLAEAGCTFCIVGHSETRGRFGKLEVPESTVGFFAETDETVNLKLKALLYHSINPILCVGETMAEREAGQTDAVIRGQLAAAVTDIEPAELYSFAVAYEPVWAIGTGMTCDAAEANRVCGMIRGVLADVVEPDVADYVRILYGGSVKAGNAAELFAQPEIDGGLVGGASLDPDEFVKIVQSA